MLTENDLKGLYVPVITPFDEEYELDVASFYNLTYHLFEDEINGLVVGGTTGESPGLSSDEMALMFTTAQTARQAAAVDVPIIVGTGTNDTMATVKKTEHAAELGADAALVVVPYYNRPSQKGIIEHFRRVAEVGLPVILYEIPHRTGVTLELDTVRSILDLDGVIGMKDSTPSIHLVSELSRLGSKPVLCGDDALLFAALCCGAKGAMSATANMETERFVDLLKDFEEGRITESKQQFEQLSPLIRLLFAEPNPAPLKWMLAQRGLIESDTLRLPMVPVGDSLREHLAKYV
ncbi:4-hydroxy-tetrahydrodipicolinate synthase [Paenibacillus hexagrammi]|uniref:4-hydroxy-tetrahydrodipicolinate synthase n=1 Tax=Paenibacillus hexagrammi TaxID=2908839 RepID=A0ABY3SPJ9_9BACL|nr:4-hydroxy-tetrahydrodipicolinate synthase [Paenibacillus sp. YPD9-1]UJF35169.1 4-hydroxy-tetrahydrodipicolinate synthase [Paenibacillus sp. YPD9-1]